MKFTIKSSRFIKIFTDICYKQTLSKKKIKYSLLDSFCILMDCKHSVNSAFEVMSYMFKHKAK